MSLNYVWYELSWNLLFFTPQYACKRHPYWHVALVHVVSLLCSISAYGYIFLLPLCAPSWIMLQIHCLVHQFSLQFFTLSIGFVASMTIFNFLKFYLVLYQIHLTFCVLTESGLRVENSIYNPQLCTLRLLLTYSKLRHGMDNNTLL